MVLVNERLNYRGTVTLNIRAASVTSHTVTLPNGRLQVNTEPGAQVSIEGQPMGVAPLGPLPVQIGNREVVVASEPRHAAGVRRTTPPRPKARMRDGHFTYPI